MEEIEFVINHKKTPGPHIFMNSIKYLRKRMPTNLIQTFPKYRGGEHAS